MMGVVTVLVVALLASIAQGVTKHDTGAGYMVYKLGVTQDVWLEDSSNFNSYQYLIVSKLPQYPNKRSLVQFENLPSECSSSQVQSAKMYLYYVYAHKASWQSITLTPFIPRYLEVHLVKKAWNEAQATRTQRLTGVSWSSAWLGLDGTDAEESPQPGRVTMFPYRPAGFVELDITDAVKKWSGGVPNNGLVIRATNELKRGRSIRFASNAMSDSSKHAFVLVRCAPVGQSTVIPVPPSSVVNQTKPQPSTMLYTSPSLSTKLSPESAIPSTTLNPNSVSLKGPSHDKLKFANSCWQTQVGVCERHKNSWQTCWQTVGDK